MNLWDAPFRKPLRVIALEAFGDETRLVLVQLGIDPGEVIEKIHSAPLNDPVSLRLGEHVFTLRQEACRKIQVEVVA